MKITVTGRHVDVSESFRRAVEEGLKDLAVKHGVDPVDATVVLSKPTYLFHTDVTVHLGREVTLRASAEGEDGYASLTKALDMVMQRLRRHKKRVTDHHKHRDSHTDRATVDQFILNGQASDTEEAEGDYPAVIAETKMDIHKMSVADAVMRLDFSQEALLIFLNSMNNRLNVIYRRPDGNIAWVDPNYA